MLASLGATIAYFVVGFAVFSLPSLRNEFLKYPAVYRSQEGIKNAFPVGIGATLVAILVLAVLYARSCDGRAGFAGGARFGVLIGIFAVCGFVFHNYVNLNIGWKLTLEQAVAYFFEWLLVGIVIGLVYRPLVQSAH